MGCNCLKEALLPLKESSKYAIADAMGESFDDVKEYLHIKRDIEDELHSLLKKASLKNSKQLILVCGNVGDGKSHLLSRFYTKYTELMQNFTVHNDATESSSPTKTNIDELNQLLKPLSDENLDAGNDKIVLAINLGTLGNFLAAEFIDCQFTKLKGYVERKGILDVGKIEDTCFEPDSPFQFVNFCDHHLFYLTTDGPRSELIESAIERVVNNDIKSPFYPAYEKHRQTHPVNCPIRFNFEFLQHPVNRKRVSQLLIECIVKFNLIISIRALYNFIYDMIVPYDLVSLDCETEKKKVENYSHQDFLKAIIPNYLFDHPELSIIFQYLDKCDPAEKRSEKLDDVIIQLMISDKPIRVFQEFVPMDDVGAAYQEAVDDMFGKLLSPREELSIQTFIRSVFFLQPKDNLALGIGNYHNYMSLLYYYYSGDIKKLKRLFNLIKQAAMTWYGETNEGYLNIEFGRQQLQYRISKNVKMDPVPPKCQNCDYDKVKRFEVSMSLNFLVEKDEIEIPVNYRLFDLACNISDGYRPTRLDHSDFVRFTRFIERIADSGNAIQKVVITESSYNRRFELRLDEFGDYCFAEVST